MAYRDIVELIKMYQIKQGVSVKTLASRVGVTAQVITDIRGYRLKVSPVLFEKIIKELSIIDLSEDEKKVLLENQVRAQINKHRKYEREKENKKRKEENIK